MPNPDLTPRAVWGIALRMENSLDTLHDTFLELIYFGAPKEQIEKVKKVLADLSKIQADAVTLAMPKNA